MQKNLKIFFIVLLLSAPFWWGIEALQTSVEDFFYEKAIAQNPPMDNTILQAHINQQLNAIPDYCAWRQIQAKSAFKVKINKQGKEEIIFEKNAQQQMPIASITKLLTAVTASEFYKKNQNITISKEAIAQLEKIGWLKQGEVLLLSDLLHIMLIESSNDAAFALTEPAGENGFVALMNFKAEELKMQNSHFYSATGLDPEDLNQPNNEINYSTGYDLVKLAKHLLSQHPEIIKIIGKKEHNLYLQNGIFHHTLKTTNELLEEMPNILGGKTGSTEKAGECLLLILEGQESETYEIAVILNSLNRFQDMTTLINCY